MSRLTPDTFRPFAPGYVQNECPFRPTRVRLAKPTATVAFPSRLNAMAIDPSRIAQDCGRVFTPGEIVFSLDLPLLVTARYDDDGRAECSTSHARSTLVTHAVGLMRTVLEFTGSIRIHVAGEEYPHVGLGSSGRLIAAVASAVNSVFGSPIPPWALLRYVAQNHGEEIRNDPLSLMPVQCIGGSAASGLFSGAFLVLAGRSTVILERHLSEDYRFVVGWPRDFVSPDAHEEKCQEMAHLDEFECIGERHGKAIAYRILHDLIPAAIEGDFRTVGDVIEWYRFELGSLEACSFTCKGLRELATSLLDLRRCGLADVLSLSSVGPGIFALTKEEAACTTRFREAGLVTLTCSPFNGTFRTRRSGRAKTVLS